MANKAILLQIEMLYHVPENASQDAYERDIQHFEEMGKLFNEWSTKKNEIRIPIDFSFRHSMGPVVDEEE